MRCTRTRPHGQILHGQIHGQFRRILVGVAQFANWGRRTHSSKSGSGELGILNPETIPPQTLPPPVGAISKQNHNAAIRNARLRGARQREANARGTGPVQSNYQNVSGYRYFVAFRFGGEETGVMLLVLRKSTWKAIADYTLQPVLCQYCMRLRKRRTVPIDLRYCRVAPKVTRL